jgi:hypothetical protein
MREPDVARFEAALDEFLATRGALVKAAVG